MSAERLREFLDSNEVRYVSIRHSPAFTAQEVAASAHVPGRAMAKTVMVKTGGKLAMAVLPATARVDLRLLEGVIGQPTQLATEAEFRPLFPDCELGAMPPFGNLYGLDVFLSPELERSDSIAFNAGSHREILQMRLADFVRLVAPKKVEIAYAR